MVTTSPSVKIADPTRVPLTNVPLTLRSRISVPSGVKTSVACSRDAKTSGTTMSLSLARPIVTVPAVLAGREADGRCDKNFTILVARFESSPAVAPTMVNSAGGIEAPGGTTEPVLVPARGVRCAGGSGPALTTVSSSGGIVRGGTRGGGGIWGGATGRRGASWRDGAGLGPGCTDQERVGGPEPGVDLV